MYGEIYLLIVTILQKFTYYFRLLYSSVITHYEIFCKRESGSASALILVRTGFHFPLYEEKRLFARNLIVISYLHTGSLRLGAIHCRGHHRVAARVAFSEKRELLAAAAEAHVKVRASRAFACGRLVLRNLLRVTFASTPLHEHLALKTHRGRRFEPSIINKCPFAQYPDLNFINKYFCKLHYLRELQ